ncbi:MAG: Dabb family protein [Sulfurospirillum sp.]
MVKHIVFLKFREDSNLNKEQIKNTILSLKNDIEVIREIEAGINFSLEQRAYDIALSVAFNSKKDLNTYATHPIHLKLIEELKSDGVISKVVDYEFFK